MGNLLNLAVYNPAILSDDDFLEGFVARLELTERLLNRLREITPKGVAQHILLIGQRGMGKTSMLRRIALGVAKDPDLSKLLIPLTFREEQYNVHNLHVFWCNCLDALGDYLEKGGRHDQVVKLDREVAQLESKGGDPDGNAAYALFKGWCTKEEKRPLLFLDNIDLILGGLKEQQQWGLRRILQARGGVVIVGASSGFLEAVTKVDAPFYEFFQVHLLERLSHPELLSCLRQIAFKRGDAGKKVLQVLDSDPARIHTLYDLTGGNPRTLVLLYILLEMNAEGDVIDDLERLLDQVTALYKARVEDLAPQTRVVLDAVALAWNPVTVAQVAAESGIESTSVSSQFDRLIKMGILEKVSLSTTAPVGYQLSERFFNIWYLMRNASRRLRNRLRWLTEFLRRIYSPQQLSTLAEDFIRRHKENSRCSGVYGMALSNALEDKALCHALNHHVTRLFKEQADALCERVEKYADRSELDQLTLTMEEMKKRVLACKRDWGSTTAEEFWDLLGGSVCTSPNRKQMIVQSLDTEETVKIVSLVKKLRREITKQNKTIGLPDALNFLRQALRDGVVASGDDLSHARAAAKNYESPELTLAMVCLADGEAVHGLPADELQAIAEVLRAIFKDPGKKYNSILYFYYGLFLMLTSSYVEAEIAYRKAIELSPNYAYPWNDLGYLLQNHLSRYDEAEEAYRKAIELSSNYAYPCDNLGDLLKDHLNRYNEAEQAYRKAIEIDSKDAYAWKCLGNLLQDHLNRYDEAEEAYRKAIKIDPKDAYVWKLLGNLLQDYLNRYDEAEEAYRKAIKIDPKDVFAWNFLGYLLQSHLRRYDEAEVAYRKTIGIDPENVFAWFFLGNLLQNQLSRYDEAEEAYRKAIEIDERDSDLWNGLGNLLMDHLGRIHEAESAYRNAIDIDGKASYPKANLAYLLLSQPERVEEAETSYNEAITLLPEHGKQLLTAFRAISRDNFGNAIEPITRVLEENHPELYTDYYDDLLRVLRLAKERGYGDRLLAFLDDSGLGERHWPMYAAFDAYLHGEAKLRDINPEVRGAAKRIFDWLAAKPSGQETVKRAPPSAIKKRRDKIPKGK